MADLVPALAASSLPLPAVLDALRPIAREGRRLGRLRDWAAACPEVAGQADWPQRAWWGVAANAVIKLRLADPRRRTEVLGIVDPPDWSDFDAARRSGGVILATAHLGPPKLLMNLVLERSMPLLVWTNAADLPDWLPAATGGLFLDPIPAAGRAALMIRTAVHLRSGGVLLGAADRVHGGRVIRRAAMCREWKFSAGLPALARRLNLPTFLTAAVWDGHRVRVECRQQDSPPATLPPEAWQDAWVEDYWRWMKGIIDRGPENLRFLRTTDGGGLRTDLGI